MSFIQIGVAAMRDPVTGDFLPSIPIYTRSEDAEGIAEPLGYDLMQLGKKVEEYRREARRLEEEAKARKEAQRNRRRNRAKSEE